MKDVYYNDIFHIVNLFIKKSIFCYAYEKIASSGSIIFPFFKADFLLTMRGFSL